MFKEGKNCVFQRNGVESSVWVEDRMKEIRVILLEIDLITIGFLPLNTCVIFILHEV